MRCALISLCTYSIAKLPKLSVAIICIIGIFTEAHAQSPAISTAESVTSAVIVDTNGGETAILETIPAEVFTPTVPNVPAIEQRLVPSPRATTSPRRCYKGDVWEVSTRHLNCCINATSFANPDFRVSHIENGRWQSRSIQDLFNATYSASDIAEENDQALPPLTIFYVHGNWMTVENTRERVQTINKAISKHALRPYRLVVLSWPSERDRGFVSDIRENGECADTQAHYLSYLIQHISPTSQVSLIGFSFGARTVTGALHLLGGGSLHSVSSQCGVCRFEQKFRVTLVAPAVDREWLTPNGRFGEAAKSIEWMVNLYNSRDPVLRRFRFINRLSNPIAAGFRGFAQISDPRATSPITNSELIEQFDCGSLVGNSHDEKTYYYDCPYFAKGVQNLLWQYP